jgi:RHS repeat-associated protein
MNWDYYLYGEFCASGRRVMKQLTGDLTDHYYVGDPEYNYLIKDYLGSVRLVLDGNGDVQESYWYSPYGEVVDATVTGQSPAELKFTGHEEENEGLPGFYYAGARYYNSSVGIWYSTDPAGQFASPYSYGANNPVLYIDENGECPFLIPIAFGILKGALISSVMSGATYALMSGDNFTWDEFGKSLTYGAISGAISGGAGGLIQGVGLSSAITNNIGYSMISNAASYSATTSFSG